MSEHPMLPMTSPKNSAERFSLITLDALIAAMKYMASEMDLADSREDTAAEATLNLTADIILTSVENTAARNDQSVTLHVLPAAANEDDSVIVLFSDAVYNESSAIEITVTPNDGTNNSSTPVDLTSAELVELINTGEVSGKNVVVIDPQNLRELQTASGGDSTALADGGEGDEEVATFSGGITSFTTMLANVADLRQALGVREEDFKI